MTFEDTYWMSPTVISVLVVINMIVFAFTNGYVSSISYSLAPEQVHEDLKGSSGSSVSFFLIVGIFTGTLFATFAMKNL